MARCVFKERHEVRADRAVRLGNPVNVDRTALQAEDLGASKASFA